MLETLRNFAINLGEILLIFAGFALIERARPAERGQRFSAAAFNVQYLFLYQLINRLNIRWDIETLFNIPITMLIGIALVIFAFNLAQPISELASTITRSTLGIAMACVLLSFLMMITRRKAVPVVIGFLAMENGLFFAATSATYGMPMVVEFGIALDVLVGTFIWGIFFFQVRETFDSLDTRHMEKLRQD